MQTELQSLSNDELKSRIRAIESDNNSMKGEINRNQREMSK